ncbi:site-specific integrase [Nocardia amikacinitolerans]|uniref:site-specific integrase n=1 Tax=Nocardia amikacinitolerans TaxID=756689 RepID=UPI0020A48CFA|nr:site-specific integrase [Nocardia amikacinitolerans]
MPSIDAGRTMLAECDGTDFNDRRDTAIIRLFADTGIRFGEMAPLELDFLDLNESTVLASGRDDGRALCHLVTRLALYGGAICAYGRDNRPQKRESNTLAWLPRCDDGLRIRQMLERRCDAAGIERLHPHQLRHFFSHTWLDSGGQAQDLAGGDPARCSHGTVPRSPTVVRSPRIAVHACRKSGRPLLCL